MSPNGLLSKRPEASDEDRIDLRAALRTLFDYKWFVLTFLVVGVAASALYTSRQPKVFQATCVLEYDPEPPRPLGKSVEDVGDYWLTREFFETQNQIIASRVVATTVVRALSLQHDASFVGPKQGRSEDRLVEDAAQSVQAMLTVEPDPNSRLVRVHVRAGSAERAAVISNALADAYVQRTLDERMRTTATALEWLATQLDNLRTELGESDLALHAFKREHQVLSVSLEDSQNLVANEISEFHQSLTRQRSHRVELQTQLSQLQRIEGDAPEDAPVLSLVEDGSLVELREQLRRVLAEHASLSARYGVSHPQIQASEREIDTLRDQVRAEIDTTVRGVRLQLRRTDARIAGLGALLDGAQEQGFELNLREIEYERLQRDRRSNSELYNLVLQRTTETDLMRMLSSTHVRLLDRALVPRTHVGPNLINNLRNGAFGGLFLGLLLVLLLRNIDRRIHLASDIERLGVRLLGVLPNAEPREAEHVELLVHNRPASHLAECCRNIRTNLMFMSIDGNARRVLVTSSQTREGKTTLSANLAAALAHGGRKVLLVDTDLRRPRLHKVFGLRAGIGITSYLIGESPFSEIISETQIPGLHVLPCGPVPPNPAELLHTKQFEALIERAEKDFDIVVFDSPPLGIVTDAAILGGLADTAIVVARAKHTTRDHLQSTVRKLAELEVTVAGVVLNSNSPHADGYRAYGYYYSHEAGELAEPAE